jgi:tRNA(Ile)-lysidine synthase
MAISFVKNDENEKLAASISIDEFAACDAIAAVLPDGGRIAVAVSGGPDSMALCWLLSQLFLAEGYDKKAEIHAITVDHGLRQEAAQEAENVSKWLDGWPYVIHNTLSADGDDAISSVSKVMEAARDTRYRLIEDYCARNNIGHLFVAHHMEDQAETFLFRLAKGSGLDGLASIRPCRAYSERLDIVRPLLGFSKERLIETCNSNNIPYVLDPTNENIKYARSRLRKSRQVLEAEGLTPNRLAVTAKRFARAAEALDHVAENVFQSSLTVQNDNSVSLDYNSVLGWPEEIRLRVIIRAMNYFDHNKGGYGPRMSKLENLVSAIFEEEGFKKRTLGGLVFSVDSRKRQIFVERE